jgi:UDP-N-acetylmuramoyl-tripeptide--D-alanyl-D-alanine ligase
MLPDQGIASMPGAEVDFGGIQKEVRARTITVGTSEDCDVRIFDIRVNLHSLSEDSLGTYFKLGWKGSIVPCFLPNVFGSPAVRSAGFAAAVAFALHLNPLIVSEALRDWIAPSGRMRMILGIKQTLLIDDSYNSSPNAVKAACEAVRALEWKGRCLLVLGDMAELGAASLKEHTAVGKLVASQKPEYFVAVGPLMVEAVRAARAAGLPEASTFHWPNAAAAGRFLQERIHAGDLLIIKGSQIMRMERIVKELMAEPLKAGALLVRQGAEWSQEEGRMKVGG